MKASRIVTLIIQAAALLSVDLCPTHSQEIGPKTLPKIHFEAPVHEFGEAQRGTLVRHNFVVNNTGSSPLEIKEVKPTCGCTLAGDWPKLLQPGQSGIIPIQVKTDNLRGVVTKSVRVTSNDPKDPVASLQIKGKVWTPIEYPASVILRTQKSRDSAVSKTVKITNTQEDPLTISDIRSSNPNFKAEITTLKHGKEFELTITAVPPLNYGVNRAKITVKTSNPEMSELNLTTHVTVRKLIIISPTRVKLNTGKLEKPLSKYITVSNRTEGELKLSDYKVSINGVGITLNKRNLGKHSLDKRNFGNYYRFKLTFPAGYEVPTALNAQFTFKTDKKEFPEFVVPITSFTRPTATPQLPRSR